MIVKVLADKQALIAADKYLWCCLACLRANR